MLCAFIFAGCGVADQTSSAFTGSFVDEASSAPVEESTAFVENSVTEAVSSASTESSTGKTATVTIDYADNTLYDEVSFAEDGANYDLIFFTDATVKDFTLLEMDESEVLQISDALWCIDELTPEKPVIVSTWLNDATISRGISYTDQNGKEHVFSIVLSMKDDSLSLVEFKEQTMKDESGPLDEFTEQKTLTIDEAFEAYLKGEISATDGSEKRYVYQHTCISDGKEGIDTYALYDVTGDGVPELHLKSMSYEILMCQKRELVTIYESGTNGQHGPITLLENGAMFEEHTTFETMYTYTTFDSDGTTNKTEFGLLEYEDETQSEYWFGDSNKKVTKQEFDELTKDIFAAAEKKAELNWIEWTPQ